MRDAELIKHIDDRMARAGLEPRSDLSPALAAYLRILGKWNQRINLTAYSLEQPSDEAIDRLIVEPVSMARFVGSEDRLTVDVGSGGGSPALPFVLAAPRLRQVMVESRVRKSAFLREAVRELGLKDVVVENGRLEEIVRTGAMASSIHIVTMRAVRADADVIGAVQTLLGPSGRFFWLTSEAAASENLEGFEAESVESLIPLSTSRLVIFKPH